MSCVTQHRKNKNLVVHAISATRDVLNRTAVVATAWKERALPCDGHMAAVSLCTHNAQGDYEQTMPRDAYTLRILLEDAHLCLDADGERVVDSLLQAGTCYLSRPGEKLHLVCSQGYKALHLRIPTPLLWINTDAQHVAAALDGRSLGPVNDSLLLQLARTLTDIVDHEQQGPFAGQILHVLIERIRYLRADEAAHARIARKTSLPAWRLQRVDSYVKSHLSEPITLSDMANAAGLSPMHFAAQFRVATGYRPHHYLLLCRLERAKALMDDVSLTMLDIALEVGFQTQAHFTTVFKRLTGQTPGRWRDGVLDARMAEAA